MMDDEVGSLVEKLKPQFVTKWLKTVCDVRFDVMVMCLLPKPMEFARVSGGQRLEPCWRGLGRSSALAISMLSVSVEERVSFLILVNTAERG